jgi:hypothetical protein
MRALCQINEQKRQRKVNFRPVCENSQTVSRLWKCTRVGDPGDRHFIGYRAGKLMQAIELELDKDAG